VDPPAEEIAQGFQVDAANLLLSAEDVRQLQGVAEEVLGTRSSYVEVVGVEPVDGLWVDGLFDVPVARDRVGRGVGALFLALLVDDDFRPLELAGLTDQGAEALVLVKKGLVLGAEVAGLALFDVRLLRGLERSQLRCLYYLSGR